MLITQISIGCDNYNNDSGYVIYLTMFPLTYFVEKICLS